MSAARGLSVQAYDELAPETTKITPGWLVARIRDDVLGGSIGLDPCTIASNPVGARRIYTPDDDGILQRWEADTVFVNPPYGKTMRHWVNKCLDAANLGSKVVLLVPARTGSRWFTAAWCDATDALFFNGRIRFEGEASGAHFPSVLFGYNVTLEALDDLGVRATVTP